MRRPSHSIRLRSKFVGSLYRFWKGPMHRKIMLVAALSAFSVLLLTMCTFYDQSGAVVSPNGLSCQNRTDYIFFERRQSAACYYQCPDQTIRRPEISEKFSPSSPLYSASKEDLDAQFCGLALQPTATVSPTEQFSPSPTRGITATVPPTERASPSPTQGTSLAVQTPLLTGDVTMCDLAVNLINFRMIEPVPDLNAKALAVQIADRETTCYVNATNPSLLTCTIPGFVTFPARVVVRLDNVVVNDFTFNGLGCAKIATSPPTGTP